MTEQEKRIHRCCFTGHRPEKLCLGEGEIQEALSRKIQNAIDDGYSTFISGMARGVDIWAAEIVLAFRESNPAIHLICACPYPNSERRWGASWQRRFTTILQNADCIRVISQNYNKGCYQTRNEWMINHSSRVIAVYSGASGGTRNTLVYAHDTGLDIQIIQG